MHVPSVGRMRNNNRKRRLVLSSPRPGRTRLSQVGQTSANATIAVNNGLAYRESRTGGNLSPGAAHDGGKLRVEIEEPGKGTPLAATRMISLCRQGGLYVANSRLWAMTHGASGFCGLRLRVGYRFAHCAHRAVRLASKMLESPLFAAFMN